MAGTISSLVRGARGAAAWFRPTAWDVVLAVAVEVLAFVAHVPVAIHVALAAVAFVGSKLARRRA